MSPVHLTKAIILAAGMGKRIQEDGINAPKVMRLAEGRPLLAYVLEALNFFVPEDIILVVGYKQEQVRAAFPECCFATQEIQLGTGHAVMAAFGELDGFCGDILVCCGDMPLLMRKTYEELLEKHRNSGAACTVLSGIADSPLPYGRILREDDGSFREIVEEKDCTPTQLCISELNSGVYVFKAEFLRPALAELRSDNIQGEYYLTDAPALIKKRGGQVSICRRELGNEIIGVNTPEQLYQVELIIRERASKG